MPLNEGWRLPVKQLGSHSYKFGSLAHSQKRVRDQAVAHNLECIKIGEKLGSKALTVWIADGSNFPGQSNLNRVFDWYLELLSAITSHLPADWRVFLEHKLYEPAFYSAVISDWGTSLMAAQTLGPKAVCLVDLGHHAPNVNIEQIVARLIRAGKLAGFHFNDSKYGDDDLDAGSIDPFRLYRVFNELVDAAQRGAPGFNPAYMLDQSHNVTDPIESLMARLAKMRRERWSSSLLGDLVWPAVATAIPGRGRKARSRRCRETGEESDGPRSTGEAPEQGRDERRRRAWREGGSVGGMADDGRCSGRRTGPSILYPPLACGSATRSNVRARPIALDFRQEPGAGKPHAGICAGGREQSLSLPRPRREMVWPRPPRTPISGTGARRDRRREEFPSPLAGWPRRRATRAARMSRRHRRKSSGKGSGLKTEDAAKLQKMVPKAMESLVALPTLQAGPARPRRLLKWRRKAA